MNQCDHDATTPALPQPENHAATPTDCPDPGGGDGAIEPTPNAVGPDGEGSEAAADAPEPPAPIRIFLVDDHAFFRKGVASFLASTPDLEVCGEAANASEALRSLAAAAPDLVLLDVSLPDNSGIDLIHRIHVQHPDLAILILSMHDEKLYAERSLRAGARGYLMKQEPPERLAEAIRIVMAGDVFISEGVKTTMISSFLDTDDGGRRKQGIEHLSDREIQVFEAIGRGLTTAEIADHHHLSPKTVETYRAHIKRKLGLENNNQLIHIAIRWVEAEATGKGSPKRLPDG